MVFVIVNSECIPVTLKRLLFYWFSKEPFSHCRPQLMNFGLCQPLKTSAFNPTLLTNMQPNGCAASHEAVQEHAEVKRSLTYRGQTQTSALAVSDVSPCITLFT